MDRQGHGPDEAGPTKSDAVKAVLSRAIREGLLDAGVVLNEGPIARLVGTSRTPVRAALAELEREQLIQRFPGRGYLVGDANAAPIRRVITREMLGQTDYRLDFDPHLSADRMRPDLLDVVTHALPFGQFRILEQPAAAHYRVSRTVIRQILAEWADRGIVSRSARYNWVAGPLTAHDVRNMFEIRIALEPLVIEFGAENIDKSVAEGLIRRVEAGINDTIGLSEWSAVEDVLWRELWAIHPNRQLLQMVEQSQVVKAVDKVFAAAVGPSALAPLLEAAHALLATIVNDSAAEAAKLHRLYLEWHLETTLSRLKTISVVPEPELPDFLQETVELVRSI